MLKKSGAPKPFGSSVGLALSGTSVRHNKNSFYAFANPLTFAVVSDYVSEGLLIFGAVQIVLSIAALEHVATPLLCMTVKGEATKEFTLICFLTGISLLFFVVVGKLPLCFKSWLVIIYWSVSDPSLKQIFRLMALLNFLTGCLWLANYIYKRLFKWSAAESLLKPPTRCMNWIIADFRAFNPGIRDYCFCSFVWTFLS